MHTEIGHFRLRVGEKCFNLIPSIRNMMKLEGDGKRHVERFSVLHGRNESRGPVADHYELLNAIKVAHEVIMACSDIDPSDILVDVRARKDGMKLHRRAGVCMSPGMQVVIAGGLIRHGISGVRKVKTKPGGEAADSIDLWEVIHLSMAHLDMSKDEALSLTMTEFVRLWDVKFQPEQEPGSDITDDDYDEAMKRLERANAIRDKA